MKRIIQALAKFYATANISLFTNTLKLKPSTSRTSSNRKARTTSVNVSESSNVNSKRISKRSKNANKVEDKTALSSAELQYFILINW